MRKLPDAIFVVDPKQEEIAVREARKLGIPVVAVIDTNCDPDLVDYKVPGNDDAIRAIRLFCSAIADAINEGKMLYEQSLVKDKEDEKATSEVPTEEPKRAAASQAVGGV
jgi:small subunit ribosomal protein S2